MGFLPTLIRLMSNLSGCHTTHFTHILLQLCWHALWQSCSPRWPEPGTGLEAEGGAGSIVPALCTCGCLVQTCRALGLHREPPATFLSLQSTSTGVGTLLISAPRSSHQHRLPCRVPGTVLAELPPLCWCPARGGTKAYQVYNGRSISCLWSMFATLTSVPTQTFQRAWINDSITKANWSVCACFLSLGITSYTIFYLSWIKKTVISQKSEHFNAKINCSSVCAWRNYFISLMKIPFTTTPTPHHQITSCSPIVRWRDQEKVRGKL